MKNYTIPRILFLGLAIFLQIALIVGMVIKFYQYFTYFYAVNIFISSLVVLWIVNDESNPAYKIAWIIPIMLFPIFGGLFYILIGKSSLSKKIVSKMHKIEEKTKEVLIDNQEKNAMLRSQDMDAAKISHYISNYAYYPLYYSNNTEYYRLGEEKFKRLKEELNKAERFIFMEYFIIEEGIMWNSILD
ncbi:MAG: PLDc N-terminal domain-containing protein, partial [Acetoanaerobium sp.]|nr:PLDc N-terminal domain-containing protein [Acetoanaerobium sp.]